MVPKSKTSIRQFDTKRAYAHNYGANKMTTTTQNSPWTAKAIIITTGLLLIQFIAAYVIGSRHLLTNNSGIPLPPISIMVVIPVIGFLTAYKFIPTFRAFVFAQDIRTLTMLQLWRVVGFVFLPLYAFGVLPGIFAWFAGIGDVLVGLLAFFVVSKIDRDPDYITSPGLVGFHLLGLTDFVFALGTAALAAGVFPILIPSGVTSAALDVWPLNIFPSFIVPAFIIAQLSVLLKIREVRRIASKHVSSVMQTA